MRVLVTGATGTLGAWLCRTAPPTVDLVAAWHRRPVEDGTVAVRADLHDARETRRMLASVRPDVVIHTAYTRDHDGVVAMTRHVVAAAETVRAHLVHLSSDSLFNGDGRCRDEDAEPDPVDDYGRAKATAESAIAAGAPSAALVRTSLLVSTDPDGQNVARVRAAAAAGEVVTWYRDERRQPAWARDVAEGIWRIALLPPDRGSGVWHLPGPERLTRAELGRRIAHGLGLADPGVEVDGPPADERPRDICLRDTRARHEIGWRPTLVQWPEVVRS